MYVVSYWSNKVSTSIHIFFIGIQKSNTYSKGRELDYAFCRVGKKNDKIFFFASELVLDGNKGKKLLKATFHFILSTNLFSLKRLMNLNRLMHSIVPTLHLKLTKVFENQKNKISGSESSF